MRVAIATSNGESVDVHFSKAAQFIIFDVGEKGSVLLEKRWVKPLAESRSADEYLKLFGDNIGHLSGCEMILCSKIGDEAWLELEASGMIPFAFTGFIDAAIELIRNKFAEKISASAQSRDVA